MTSYGSGEFGLATHRRALSHRTLRLTGVLCCFWLAATSYSSADSSSAPSLPADAASPPFTQVKIPPLKYGTGDVLDPLPADAPYPSNDPKNFEGIWASIGGAFGVDENGQPLPYLPEVRAEKKRLMDAERNGKPRVLKGTLCRPGGMVGISSNQFPTQIIQRPDKIIFIAEEGRAIHVVHMNTERPKNIKPSRLGYSVGHWEDNTLVIETTGFKDGRGSAGGLAQMGSISDAGRVTARITRASTGDKRNGDRLIVRRTYEDPKQFEHPWNELNVGRWRSDLEMLEFNCEESTPALTAKDLVAE